MSVARTHVGLGKVSLQRRLMQAVAIIGAGFVLFFPARQLVEQRGRMSGLDQRLTALQAENRRLEQEVSRLSDPAELEVEARERLGLVRPGEQAYYIEAAPTPKPADEPAEAKSWWSRTWTSIVSLLRGRR